MSEKQEKRTRYNNNLAYIAAFNRWLEREPPMCHFIKWRRWKRQKPDKANFVKVNYDLPYAKYQYYDKDTRRSNA